MFGFPILKSLLRFSDVEVIAIPTTLPPRRGGEMKDPGNEVASEHATTCTLHLAGYYIQFLQAILTFYLILETESGKPLKQEIQHNC